MSSTGINEDSLEIKPVDVKKSQPVLEAGTSDLNTLEKQSTSIIKTQQSANTIIKTNTSQVTLKEDSLSSLDQLAQTLLKEREDLEDNESFVTVEGCKKDITTTTEPFTIFSLNERTQNILVARNDPSNYPPPPPYDSNSVVRQGHIGQTPVYQERYVGQGPVSGPQDASRAPPYRRNYDSPDEMFNAFDSRRIRNNFVQKVYMILSVQLLITFGFIALCAFEERTKAFVREHLLLLIISIVIYLILCITLLCYEQARRVFPLNFIMLLLLTMAMSYWTAAITCYYDTYTVMVTIGVTAGVCTLVSCLACQNWFDVTECGLVLCLASLIVLIYGGIAVVISMITGSSVVFLIYSCAATLLFCMYLMYDTQQILGGRRIELSPEEYILGALSLYIDVMMIFQNLLYIFGYSFNR